MKEKYADLEVKIIEFMRGNAVLNALGSLTTTSVTIADEVDVDGLKEDEGFKESAFDDITF